jgi:GST-like protein
MIDLYTFSTPNGRKVSLALEEMGLEYNTHAINIMEDEQFAPDFLKISPNNKIPAIVDHETGISLMESGAILIYLAEKTNSFIGKTPEERAKVIEWLMWQMGGLGPMLGQAGHFIAFNPGKSKYAEERYFNESLRLIGVLEKQLGKTDFVAGDYSIADMAIWPWMASFASHFSLDSEKMPNIVRWYKAIAARPAAAKGYAVPTDAEIPTV